MRVRITTDGHLKFIYNDALAPLLELHGGAASPLSRASHVEPHPTRNGWLADMEPSGGPVLGAGGEARRLHKGCDCDDCEAVVLALDPFPTRQDALDAEVAWLREHLGL